jgi:hypothetical protein
MRQRNGFAMHPTMRLRWGSVQARQVDEDDEASPADLPDGRTVEVRVVCPTRVGGDRVRCQVEWSEGAGATQHQGRWANELRASPAQETPELSSPRAAG